MEIRLTTDLMVTLMIIGVTVVFVTSGLLVAIPSSIKAMRKVKGMNRRKIALPSEKQRMAVGTGMVLLGFIIAALYPSIKSNDSIYQMAQSITPGESEKNNKFLTEAQKVIDNIHNESKLVSGKYTIVINGKNQSLKIGQVSPEGIKLVAVTGDHYIIETRGEKIIMKIGSPITTIGVRKKQNFTFNVL